MTIIERDRNQDEGNKIRDYGGFSGRRAGGHHVDTPFGKNT